MTWCKSPDVGLIKPDLTIFLDLPIEIAEKRGGWGEERYEKKEMQNRVRGAFLQLREEEWMVIDAREAVESVHENVWTAVKEIVKGVSGEVREGLWQ